MNRLRHGLRFFLWVALVCVFLGLISVGTLWLYLSPKSKVIRGIVYTQRHGHELTLDIIRPAKPNGIGVLTMVSGGWKSDPAKLQPWMVASFLRQGHTVIAVSHLSQPEASIQEIVEDVQKATRFVRMHAAEYGIDPQRLGVMGGSSGGHLSLMLATRGGPGKAEAADPVDRQSSAVQAAAVFYPVTDLLNLGTSTENLHDGGPPKSFKKAFGPKAANLAEWKIIGREVSPMYHITPELPPILIAHGDADTLVPLDQSQRFQQQAAQRQREVELIVRPGKKHGWVTMLWDAYLFASWFTEKMPLSNAAHGS